MRTIYTIMICVAVLMFAAAGYLDYEYQASLHGWRGLLDLHARAPHWGIFDFIPHDLWHVVQFLRNHLLLFAAAIAANTGLFIATENRDANRVYLVSIASLVLLGSYAIGRAIGFTLVMELLK